jgi:hypothetical protein
MFHDSDLVGRMSGGVLRIDPSATADWSDEEVAQRWVRLFPAREAGEPVEDAYRLRDPDRWARPPAYRRR